MDKHKTTVTDITGDYGYGMYGHGTWRVRCYCGWSAVCQRGGKNAAEAEAWAHRAGR
jgi:hypothetical protein